MTEITIRPAPGTWSVRAMGAVILESDNALELTEGSHPPVIYFPREDVPMAFFEQSATTSHCPHKGDATYYTLHGKSGPIADAAWSYESPKEAVAQIAGHLAFYTDKVAVEHI